MKKKNSVKITVIATLVVLVLAAFVFVQPYLNTTAFTANEEIAEFLCDAFGKYPRFVNEEDLAKVKLLEIGTSEGTQYVSFAFDSYIEKRDEYIDAYEKATAEGTEAPLAPEFTEKDYRNFATDGSVADFVDITKFTGVKEVNIMEDAYSLNGNLNALKDAKDLEFIVISGSTAEDAVKISDISALSDKTALTTVSITNNAITDISALANLAELESVALDNNAITDISALAGKEKLISVSAINNDIADISALASANALETLTLDDNAIVDISALNGKEKLAYLSLSGNQIVDIAPVASMKALSVASLSNNAITDVSPLATLGTDNEAQIAVLLSENEGITNWETLDNLPENVIIVGKPAEETAEETTTEETTDAVEVTPEETVAPVEEATENTEAAE